MAEELRWVLIVISVFVIGGLLVHGLWSVRKKDNPEIPANERVEPQHTAHSHSLSAEPAQSVAFEQEEPQFGELNFDANEPQIDTRICNLIVFSLDQNFLSELEEKFCSLLIVLSLL